MGLAGDPLGLAASVRRVVQQTDVRVPVSSMITQARQIDQTIGQERTFAMLCTCFATLALLMACVGLYGTMAYSVARRTNGIGIRMALGAEHGRLIWMVLRDDLPHRTVDCPPRRVAIRSGPVAEELTRRRGDAEGGRGEPPKAERSN